MRGCARRSGRSGSSRPGVGGRSAGEVGAAAVAGVASFAPGEDGEDAAFRGLPLEGAAVELRRLRDAHLAAQRRLRGRESEMRKDPLSPRHAEVRDERLVARGGPRVPTDAVVLEVPAVAAAREPAVAVRGLEPRPRRTVPLLQLPRWPARLAL